jgi:hypothetical protein
MAEHYRKAKETPDRKLYKAVASFGGWMNIRIEIVASFLFTTKEDLWKQEDSYIKLDDSNSLNTNRAMLSPEERAEQKKEVSSRCKKTLYVERRKDPEWVASERERHRKLYAKKKSLALTKEETIQ